MTTSVFRKIALSMPGVIEAAHMGHPDFRLKGKIFATLFTRDGEEFGMVKLTPVQQRVFVDGKPAIYEPIKGGWGAKGCTQVRLAKADQESVKDALFTAWCNTAPKELVEQADSRPNQPSPRPSVAPATLRPRGRGGKAAG